jgi:hypothetical protein
MRNVLDKSCRENQNTFYVQQLFFEKCAVYEINLKKLVEPRGPQMTSQHDVYELLAG